MALVGLLATLLAVGPTDAQPRGRIDTGGLATGPYATMHALVERTFLKVDIARVDVRVDEPTRQRLELLVRGQAPSQAQQERIARVASQAQNAWARLTFLHHVSVSEFVRDGQKDLKRALKDGLIDRAGYQTVSFALANAFSFLGARGFRDGDQLLYRVRPDSLRTVLRTREGAVLMDKIDLGAAFPRGLLGSYFAPGSTLRDRLIQSLFRTPPST